MDTQLHVNVPRFKRASHELYNVIFVHVFAHTSIIQCINNFLEFFYIIFEIEHNNQNTNKSIKIFFKEIFIF